MALLNVKTADDFYAYLRRLAGDTYGSQSDESVFQRQLRAWAVLLALGRSEIDRAFENAYPDLADAMVEQWERAFNLPNDSARTLAQRQARIAAHERTMRGAARDDLQDSLDATGTTVHFVANRRDEVEVAGSVDAAIFQTTLQFANEDFYNPIVRNAIETLYGNALPAKNVGALDKLGPGHSSCVETDAKWGSSTHFVGRDALARQISTPRTERSPVKARIRTYGPGSRLDAEDLNAIQETLLGAPLVGQPNLTTYATQTPGIVTRWFAITPTGGGTPDVLDNSIDWRDRMILINVQQSATRNLRPGQADDNKYGVPDTAGYAAFYSGPGSAGGATYQAIFNGSTYHVTAAGVLRIINGGHVVGVIWGSEKVGMR